MTIEDLLQGSGVQVAPPGHRHTRQGWINFDCPWCGPGSGRFHMGYHKQFGYLNCWRCGRHPTIDTFAAILHKTTHETALLLRTVPREAVAPTTIQPKKLRLPGLLGPLKSRHINYLKRRGFNPAKLTKLWDLQGLTVSTGGLSWRIFIPNFRHGQIVSWAARATYNSTTKRYLAAKAEEEAFPAKHWLYGLDYCRHAIIVCEGPTDVWRIGPGAVATMGAAVSTEQIELMSRYPVRVVCFDNDAPGQYKAEELVRTLTAFPGQTYNVTLDAEDAGAADEDEIQTLRRRFLD